VNNAGIIHYQRISNITEEQYDETFDTNIKSHVFLTQLALPHIIKNKGNKTHHFGICFLLLKPLKDYYGEWLKQKHIYDTPSSFRCRFIFNQIFIEYC